MKKLFIFLIILMLIYAGVKLSIKSPDQTIPSATEEVPSTSGSTEATPAKEVITSSESAAIAPAQISVKYSGYGPGGKEEHGSVSAKESTLVRADDVFSGSVTFDMNSITSVPVKETLINHLKSKEFFDADTYPTATFVIAGATALQIKGDLTLRGITQSVTLPITKVSDGSYSSTVRVNMELFGIKQTFADKEFVLELAVR